MNRPSLGGRRRAALSRSLRIEPLEIRRLLSAEKPWQNDVRRLDVDNNGTATPSDLLFIINHLLLEGAGPLPVPPPVTVTRFIDTTGDNRINVSDALAVINGLLQPPEVTLSMFANFTTDVTPEVTVTVQSAAGLPDGTLIDLDVDFNNDGDFADSGERGQTQSTLYNGRSLFNLRPGLVRSGEAYQVRLQARARDADGVQGSSLAWPLMVDTRMSDVLENYAHAPDDSYSYAWTGTAVNGNSVTPYTYYVLSMTSQTWRSTGDVNDPQWDHWLEVYVPKTLGGDVAPLNSTGLLFVRGGSNTSNPPTQPSNEFAYLATANQSVVARLHTVPNQQVVFAGESSPREEDEIIAYTLDKYLNNLGAPGNETWPVLLPMVKSAVQAMTTVQDFIPSLNPARHVDDFFVSGESKRGWTTWLTAAVDDRVRGIMPGVFDNLNQAPQMVNHYGVLGKFSEEVHDYTDLDIFERILTPEAVELGKIVDPYSYLHNGRFDDMPKLILNSAGDEFFVPDSSRFYFQDLPGTQNYLRYIPNTGHGLDSRAVTSRATFFDAILHDRPLPEFSWTVEQDGSIHVKADTPPSQVRLWQKHNPDARDFRSGYTPQYVWTSQSLVDQGDGTYVGNVEIPSIGAIAYFIELTFPNSVIGAEPYVFTTEARIKSLIPLAEWPYDSLPLAMPLAAVAASDNAPSAVSRQSTADAVCTALTVGNWANERQELTSPAVVVTLCEPQTEARDIALTEILVADEPLEWLAAAELEAGEAEDLSVAELLQW